MFVLILTNILYGFGPAALTLMALCIVLFSFVNYRILSDGLEAFGDRTPSAKVCRPQSSLLCEREFLRRDAGSADSGGNAAKPAPMGNAVPQAQYCYKCGFKLKPDSLYCSGCGAQVPDSGTKY